MTVVVAAQWGNKGIIAADTLIVSGDSKVKNIKNFSKVVDFGNFFVGFSGDCAVFHTLQEIAQNKSYMKRVHMRMRNQKDVSKFAHDVFDALKDVFDCLPGTDKDEDNTPRSVHLVILTKNSMYFVDEYLFVSEHEKFVTSGNAEGPAIGVMYALYDTIKSEKELKAVVEKAIVIACENSTQAALPLILYELNK